MRQVLLPCDLVKLLPSFVLLFLFYFLFGDAAPVICAPAPVPRPQIILLL